MARTFSPAEYLGSLEASIRTPESAAPVLGAALVSSGSLDQLGWTPRAALVEPVVAPLNSNQYLAADRTWKSIPPIDSGSVVGALGYTPANDSQVVKVTGNQSIAGFKTFTNNVTVGDGSNYNALILNTIDGYYLNVGWGPGGNFGLDSWASLSLRAASTAQVVATDGQINLYSKYGLFVRDDQNNPGPMSAGIPTFTAGGRSVVINPNYNGFQSRISASTGQIELASVDSNALVSGNNVYLRSASDGWIHLNDTVTVSKTGDVDFQRSNLGQNHWWRQTVDNGVAGTDGLTLVSMNNSNQFKFRRDGAFQANRFTTNMNADQIEGSAFSGRFRVGSSSGVSVYSTFNDVKLLGSSVAIRNAADNADAPLSAGAITANSVSVVDASSPVADRYLINGEAGFGRKFGLFVEAGGLEGGVKADSQLRLKAGGSIRLMPTGSINGVIVSKSGNEILYDNFDGRHIFRPTWDILPLVSRAWLTPHTANLFEAQLANGTPVMSVSAAGAITASGPVNIATNGAGGVDFYNIPGPFGTKWASVLSGGAGTVSILNGSGQYGTLQAGAITANLSQGTIALRNNGWGPGIRLTEPTSGKILDIDVFNWGEATLAATGTLTFKSASTIGFYASGATNIVRLDQSGDDWALGDNNRGNGIFGSAAGLQIQAANVRHAIITPASIQQCFTSGVASYRSRMLAAGQRASEVGDGAGAWQSIIREEYNAGGGRLAIYGKTPVGQFTAPAVATDLASAVTAVNTHTVSLTSFGLYA